MKIVIQTLKQENIEVILEDSATLLDLKTHIGELKNFNIDHIKIIFSGSILNENDKKLIDYKLTERSKVVVLLQKPKPISSEKKEEPILTSEPNISITAFNQPTVSTDTTANISTSQNDQNLQSMFTSTIQQNPQLFMQLLMSNSQIQQLYGQNPQIFTQLLSDPNFINNVLHAGQMM